MKQLTCASCNSGIEARDEHGNKVCPICEEYKFKEVEIDIEEARCSHCNKTIKELNWHKKNKIPFYNSKTKTFYCGCRGWD